MTRSEHGIDWQARAAGVAEACTHADDTARPCIDCIAAALAQVDREACERLVLLEPPTVADVEDL